MPDPVSRGAARTATLVALPIAALVGLLAFWLLGGFGGGEGTPAAAPSSTRPHPSSTVSVSATPLPDRAATVCRALVATLPGSIRDQRRRPVSAGPEQNAAYGAPAITVRCGVRPAHVAATDTVFPLDGVCYVAERAAAVKGSAGSVWTTVDREVPIAITVPPADTGAGQWVAEFSDSIAGSVPSLDDPPTGCAE